jgi:hypothetical protein
LIDSEGEEIEGIEHLAVLIGKLIQISSGTAGIVLFLSELISPEQSLKLLK